jgi:DNA primase
VDFLDFQIAHKKSTTGGDLRGQVQLIEQTAVTIAMSPSVAARDLMIRSHASQLGVSEDTLRKEVNIFVRRQMKGAAEQAAKAPARDDAKRLLAMQHPSALMLCSLALANQEIIDWLRSVDLEPVLQGLLGTELLGRIWHASFPAGDGPAQGAFFAGLAADEQAAFAQLQAQAMPGGKLDDAKQVLNSLDLARLQYLANQAEARCNQPGLDHAEVDRLQAQILGVIRQGFREFGKKHGFTFPLCRCGRGRETRLARHVRGCRVEV